MSSCDDPIRCHDDAATILSVTVRQRYLVLPAAFWRSLSIDNRHVGPLVTLFQRDARRPGSLVLLTPCGPDLALQPTRSASLRVLRQTLGVREDCVQDKLFDAMGFRI